jgi:hypothetical protein
MKFKMFETNFSGGLNSKVDRSFSTVAQYPMVLKEIRSGLEQFDQGC